MINYVEVNIKLHGLTERTLKKIQKKIRECLNEEFELEFSSDIEIEILEYSGFEEEQ